MRSSLAANLWASPLTSLASVDAGILYFVKNGPSRGYFCCVAIRLIVCRSRRLALSWIARARRKLNISLQAARQRRERESPPARAS